MSLVGKNNEITRADGAASDQAYKVPSNKTLAWRFGLELVSVSVVAIIVLLPYIFKDYVFSKPQRRGFFCDDEDLKHPYKEEQIRFNPNLY